MERHVDMAEHMGVVGFMDVAENVDLAKCVYVAEEDKSLVGRK